MRIRCKASTPSLPARGSRMHALLLQHTVRTRVPKGWPFCSDLEDKSGGWPCDPGSRKAWGSRNGLGGGPEGRKQPTAGTPAKRSSQATTRGGSGNKLLARSQGSQRCVPHPRNQDHQHLRQASPTEKTRQTQRIGDSGAWRPQRRRNCKNLLGGRRKAARQWGKSNRDFWELKMRPQNHPTERLQAKAENVF